MCLSTNIGLIKPASKCDHHMDMDKTKRKQNEKRRTPRIYVPLLRGS